MFISKYTDEEKKIVLEFARKHGPKAAHEEYDIPQSTIRSWMRKNGVYFEPQNKIIRDEQGMYTRGVSGNPGGIPRRAVEARRIAADLSPDGIKLLWEIANNVKASYHSRIQAINSILDRGMGKPKQEMSLDMDVQGMNVQNTQIVQQIVDDPEAKEHAIKLFQRMHGTR